MIAASLMDRIARVHVKRFETSYSSVVNHLYCCIVFRQGNYTYKKGTSCVLTETVRKVEFVVESTQVKVEAMDTV